MRESLKEQLRADMAAEMAKPENKTNGFGAFGAMLGMAMVEPIIDGFVTPASMSAMIKQGKMQRDADAPAQTSGKPADWSIEHKGLSRFTATPKAPAGQKVPSMIFEREDLGWKLVGIELPEGGLGAPGT